MNGNAKKGLLLTGPSQEVSAASGSTATTVAQGDPPRVAGRLDTYRSRSGKWHRQVKVERCPGCGHPHLHRAPLPLVRSVLKTGPCGLAYVVQLRTEAVTG
ncbi:hypothetical protein [Streptomyces erythrochromogenes]|uniref:hypothetical protein n=1 Tax=Streptomyces erythrochromogenes TaxID=285574 RepID=UPI00225BAAF9|nr:hypothetical protein [Streptomyces erythrochromogenes]MCX5586032.1 hypothetical protein [Streptomyces erythrochromogenes]